MLHRVKKEQDENRDKWIGVGGKFLPGETPEQCVLREAREETGLVLKEYSYRGIVDFHSDEWPEEEMHLFLARGFTGTEIACDEGDLEWMPRKKLLSLPMWEGDRIFLRLLEQDRPFFRLHLEYRGEKLIFAALDGEALAAEHPLRAQGAL